MKCAPWTHTRCCGAQCWEFSSLGQESLKPLYYSIPVSPTELFQVLLTLPQLWLEFHGLTTAGKTLAFLTTALWGLLHHLARTETLSWSSTESISAGSEMACLGENSWSAERKRLDEVKCWSVVLFLRQWHSFASSFFCWRWDFTTPSSSLVGLQKALCPGSGSVIGCESTTSTQREEKQYF